MRKSVLRLVSRAIAVPGHLSRLVGSSRSFSYPHSLGITLLRDMHRLGKTEKPALSALLGPGEAIRFRRKPTATAWALERACSLASRCRT